MCGCGMRLCGCGMRLCGCAVSSHAGVVVAYGCSCVALRRYMDVTHCLDKAVSSRSVDEILGLLQAWGICVAPIDHDLINSSSLFLILQRLLSVTLDNLAVATAEGGSREIALRVRAGSDADTTTDGAAPRWLGGSKQAHVATFKNLEDATIKLVVLLVVQVATSSDLAPVAFAGASSSSTPAPPPVPLRRAVSGPETLSEAVFNVLFHELQSALRVVATREGASAQAADAAAFPESPAPRAMRQRAVVGMPRDGDGAQAAGGDQSAAPSSSPSSAPDAEEVVMTEITTLLLTVAPTDVARRALNTPPWLALLLRLFAAGSMSVQRRVSRLLRVLLPAREPMGFRVRGVCVSVCCAGPAHGTGR